jgi:hypothetical protein
MAETNEEKATREAAEAEAKANADAEKVGKKAEAEAKARAEAELKQPGRYIVDGNIVNPDGKVIMPAPGK